MSTGTIIIFACAGLLVFLGVLFRKDLSQSNHDISITNDPTKGLDGSSGVVGMSTKDLDIDYGED